MSIKTWNAETQLAEPLVPGTVEKEHYSTEEVKTNKTWIDGKPIYRKVITNVSWSSGAWNSSILSKIDVSTIDTPISILGIGGTVRANSSLQFDKGSGIRAEASAHNGDGTVILEYTKKD